MLKAVLPLFPLDTYDNNVYLMDKTESDKDLDIPIWEEYKQITSEYTDKEPVFLERFEFYERARKAYAVVVTGEGAIYANVILKKGVVK
jgi:L-fucose mutarotase